MVDSESSLSSPPATDDEMTVEPAPMDGSKKKAHKRKQGNILTFFNKKARSPTPPRMQRDPSPEHVYAPEDNQDIPVRVERVNRVVSRRDGPSYAVGLRQTVANKVHSLLSCSAHASTKHSRAAHLMSDRKISRLVLQRARRRPMSRVFCAPCSAWSSIARSLSSQYHPADTPVLVAWTYWSVEKLWLTSCHSRKGHYGRALEMSVQTQKSQWPLAWGGVNPLSGNRSFLTMTAEERVGGM